MTFDGEDLYRDLASKAAGLMESLVANHPFVDGNKRTAVAAALTFLDMNGIEVDADENEFYDLVIGVAEGRVSKAAIAVFLDDHARR